MITELLVATRNTDKLDEIRSAVSIATHVKLLTLRDIDVPATSAEDAVEAFDTFLENAIAKARYFQQLTGMPTLADDSGLVVDALHGAPGVRSKRFAIDAGYVTRDVAGKALDEANNRLLLERLEACDERSAHYVSAVAFARGSCIVTAIGSCSGRITREARGSGGFGYDPLFEVAETGSTFGEWSREEKNARSHRALAMRAIAPHLK